MLIKNHIKKFEKKGVVVIKNFFSKSEIRKLIKNLDTYISKNKNKLIGKDINYVNGEVNSLHKIKGSYFNKLCNSKKILKTSATLLKINPKFKNCEYFAKPAKIGLGSPMHQDNFYWNLKNSDAITMWIALTPATKKNGTIDYLIGSHKLGTVEHEASYAPGSSQKVKNLSKYKKYKKESFNLKIGDCLIHHSEIIHGSRPNKSNKSRKGFTIQIMDKNTSIDKKAFAKYQLSLKKQINKRSKLN